LLLEREERRKEEETWQSYKRPKQEGGKDAKRLMEATGLRRYRIGAERAPGGAAIGVAQCLALAVPRAEDCSALITVAGDWIFSGFSGVHTGYKEQYKVLGTAGPLADGQCSSP
jgi:hypothetical protein